ncbi:MAG: sugar phosphate isomerase/epimerase family protein [Armatimonadota bacterium]|nr:sugar phosphate isomerase/epimerase family protein [Armatimonadota bacterium]MDR7448292.1 sugar phosphate isomerase/epimerase family protein [Armatimonadota bacterium]MDR7458321.1 sugar phosphate isomerase/epimerase family protein [Armatimonadota bacterium]MDR7478376.1 sugar phosphate isomerase/epimerase family protein [Armatimonadota bacterium]MDR7487310.1 sugar phosphate isomerase/epimerase family protein [Armatimonadota bacterium]
MPSGPGLAVSQFAVLTEPIGAGLQALARTGIPALEIFMEGPQWWAADAFEEVRRARSAFAGPVSLHPPAWDVNIASYTAPVREAALGVYRQALEWAHRLEAAYVVVHVGWRGDPSLPRPACLRRAEEAIGILAPLAREAGVVLAVENVGWHGQEVCDQEEFTALAARLPDTAGVLLDVGHAYLAGWDLPEAFRTLASRLVAVHLHDNDGVADRHLPIGDGTIGWAALHPVLHALPARCQCVLEYAPGTALDRLREGAALLARWLAR